MAPPEYIKVEFTFSLTDIRETFRQSKNEIDSPMPFSHLDLDQLQEFIYENAEDIVEEYLADGVEEQVAGYEPPD